MPFGSTTAARARPARQAKAPSGDISKQGHYDGRAYGSVAEARQTPQRMAKVSMSSAVGSTTKLLGFITEVYWPAGTWLRPKAWPISWAIVIARALPREVRIDEDLPVRRVVEAVERGRGGLEMDREPGLAPIAGERQARSGAFVPERDRGARCRRPGHPSGPRPRRAATARRHRTARDRRCRGRAVAAADCEEQHERDGDEAQTSCHVKGRMLAAAPARAKAKT